MHREGLNQSKLWQVATLGPLGNAKNAPGTWGSIPGLAVGMLFYEVGLYSFELRLLLLGLLTAFSWWVIDKVETRFEFHDDQRIVIDELCGQAWVTAFFEPTLITLGLTFMSFRFFDISKPLLIGWLDRKAPGAWGTLFDDVVAGLVSIPTVYVLLKLI